MSKRFTTGCAVTLLSVTAACAAALATSTAVADSPRDVTMRASTHMRPIEIDRGAAAVWQSLKKLGTRASLLYFTAHPDDEDGGMLVYESRGQGVRTALVTLNRGESGQNVMSNDYFDRLGLVRTQELLAADRYYGVEQYFSTVVDYGFSKTKAQALQKWSFDRVLRDEVRVVRIVRPLVIASTFVGGPSDGHGNHQVAGEMAQEVYKAAGDPNMFPEQIAAGLRPWAPLKVYARVPFHAVSSKGIYDYATKQYVPVRFRNYIANSWTDGLISTQVRIPEGEYAPMLGGGFNQISKEGLGQQKSQNGGPDIPELGRADTPYHLWASRVATPGASGGSENSIFEGVDTTLVGIAGLAAPSEAALLRPGLEQIQSTVRQATQSFSAADPARIAPILAKGLSATNALIAKVDANTSMSPAAKYDVLHELRIKQAQFNDALTEALGLAVYAVVAPEEVAGGPVGTFGLAGNPTTLSVAIPGQKVAVNVRVTDAGTEPVTVTNVGLAHASGHGWQLSGALTSPASLAAGATKAVRVAAVVPDDAEFTEPYYSRPSIEQPYYDIKDKQYTSLPNMPYPLSAHVAFQYRGVTLQLAQVVQAVKRVTGEGTVYEPLVVGPAVSVTLAENASVVPLGTASFPMVVTVHSNVKGPAQGTVHLNLPPGWSSSPATAKFQTSRDGADVPLSFSVNPKGLAEKAYSVTAVASYGGKTFKRGYFVTGYTGLRPYYYYREASLHTTGVDVKVAPGLKVGYVVGTGSSVPEALSNLGVHVHFLTDDDLASGDLSQFGTIIVGVRAYTARPALRTFNERLLNFVRNGGNLVVQYQAPDYNHNYGPYPYTLGNDVTVMDEHSNVKILEPGARIFNWPNKISEADFGGWVEERGHGFMGSWGSEYQALAEMHDPDQAPQRGGLLVAHYGKGVYIYAALAFYRQFIEGVPGAYRIFANLISAGGPGSAPSGDKAGNR